MLNLITGGAGSGKSYEMMKRISAAVSQGRTVYAIVPDQFNFEYNRLLYNFMGMQEFNKMEIVNFSRIARYILTEYKGLKGKYADDTVKNIVMTRVIAKLNEQKSLNFYANQAKRKGFVTEALEIVKTFTNNGVSAEALTDALPVLSDSIKDKISDISLICTEYFRTLAEYGFKDGETDIIYAAEKALQHNYFAGTDVFIDEFKSFTPDEYEMLRAMMSGCSSCTVCIATENETPMEHTVFEAADRTLSKLTYYANECGIEINRTSLSEYPRFAADELEFLSRNILRYKREQYGRKCEAVKIYTASDPYNEADFVCAEIKHLVMEKGYKYSDIAVTARQKEVYSSALDAAFERNGIPFYTDDKISISHKALIIFIKTAMKIVSSPRFSTEDILRYIKTGCLKLSEVEINAIEDYCYMWSVDGNMWTEPFRSKGQAEFLPEKVRLKIMTPLLKLKQNTANKKASEICTAISDFLGETDVRNRLIKQLPETDPDDTAALMARREIKQMWDMLCGLLQTIYRTLGDTEISISDFTDIFNASASGLSLSSPPRTLDSVHFTAAHTARFSNPKVLFVIGVNEGVFPFSAKSSPLLTDRDISELKKSSIIISGSVTEKTADERFVVYNTFSAPTEKLYISYPVAEVSGKPLYPSSAVKQTVEIFGGTAEDGSPLSDIELNAEKLGMLYFCMGEKSGYYQYVQDFKRDSSEIASLKKALEDFNSVNKDRIEYLNSLKSQKTHDISPDTAKKLFGKDITLSASRFEDYKNCPFMFFCKMGLNLYPRNKIEYNPQSRGNIVHYCLGEVIKSLGSKLSGADRNDISAAVKKALDDYYAGEQIGGDYGKSARFNAAYQRLEATIVKLVMRLRDEFSNSDFKPVAFEYELSHKASASEPPMTIDSDDKNDPYKIFFIGTIDRIDTCEKNGQNYVRVIDYKTGKKVFELKELLDGMNMQMLLYLFALTDDNAPANSGPYHASKPAGILYMPAREPGLTLPRETDNAALKEAVCNALRMNGLLLNEGDFEIIKAMDKTVNTNDFTGRSRKADYLPITIKNKLKSDKDSAVTINSDNTVSEKEFELIRTYCTSMLKQTAADIRNGSFKAEPLARKVANQTAPCCYCDYKSICGNYPELILKKQPASELGNDHAEKEILKRDTDNKKKKGGK